MRKMILMAIAAISVSSLCFAQDDAQNNKVVNQYLGVQANQLFRQIINLNSNAVISNPYMVTYSIIHAKTGWGGQVGFGFNYEDITDQITPANHESKINDLFYRVGVTRKFMIGKRFEAGYGLDIVGDSQDDKTFATSVTNFSSNTDSVVSVSTNNTSTIGFGAQFNLGFHITDKIMISTESTYYYTVSKMKQNTTTNEYVKDSFNPQFNTHHITTSNNETQKTNVAFSIPVALFLVLKF